RALLSSSRASEEALRRALECVKTEGDAKALLASEAGRRQEELSVVPDIYGAGVAPRHWASGEASTLRWRPSTARAP
ncbi:MAG: hypothetical protein RXO24_08755, partial [Acidilobus sp.]